MNAATQTVVARLTPPGKSAIACVGVHGPDVWDAIQTHFRRPNSRPLPDAPLPRSLIVGALGNAAAGRDEVVLFVRQTHPHAAVEIQCHGGPEVVRFIESLFTARGARVISPEEWNHLLHGEQRAAILNILSHCPTPRTAAIALDQLHGACVRGLDDIDRLLLARQRDEAIARIDRQLELAVLGEHLIKPWKVALIGPPNVGKSSLINALAGFTRSIVSPTPGTTRDVVSTRIAIDGWPIELLDTAGLRDAGDSLEAEGIAHGRTASGNADLVLQIADATAPLAEKTGIDNLLVLNKIDLTPNALDPTRQPTDAIRVSAQTGIALDRLAAAIVNRLIPNPPQPGEAVPVTSHHREILNRLAEIARNRSA